MRYYKDFKAMQKKDFIKESVVEDLYRNDIVNEINALYNKISNLKESEVKIVEEVLKYMSHLGCIKELLNMKVTINEIKDAKYQDNRYLQARGSIALSKGSRYSSGFYLGRKKEQNEGEIGIDQYNEGRYELIKKMLPVLLEANGL